jgi:hypothetical protein
MNIDNIASVVIDLPRTFYSRNDASMYSLLRESGYFSVHEQVTESVIRDALRRRPELTLDWIGFSEAKRSSSGWFLRRGQVKGYQVGHYPGGEPVGYSDEFAACAAFIKREIEDIRTDSDRTG